MTTEENKKAAQMLRAAADKIEAMDDAGRAYAELSFFGTTERERLAAALALADEGSIRQDSNRGTHWAKFTICGVNAVAYFNAETLGRSRVKKVTTYKTTTASVLDLVKKG